MAGPRDDAADITLRQQRLAAGLLVLRVNPVQRFYARLGFVIVQQTPERLFMQWSLRD
jgi:hypothetical protein